MIVRYRKAPISNAVRREVARRYGATPGREVEVACYYCGAVGTAWLSGERGWASFPGMHLDHLEPEYLGGLSVAENIVVACRSCNLRKGARPTITWPRLERLASVGAIAALVVDDVDGLMRVF